MVDDRRDLAVRVDLEKFRLVIVALPDVDEDLLIGQPGLLEHDVDFLYVRTGQRIKVNHGGLFLAGKGLRYRPRPHRASGRRRWSLLYSPYRDAIESSRQAKVFARSGAQQQKGNVRGRE